MFAAGRPAIVDDGSLSEICSDSSLAVQSRAGADSTFKFGLHSSGVTLTLEWRQLMVGIIPFKLPLVALGIYVYSVRN